MNSLLRGKAKNSNIAPSESTLFTLILFIKCALVVDDLLTLASITSAPL